MSLSLKKVSLIQLSITYHNITYHVYDESEKLIIIVLHELLVLLSLIRLTRSSLQIQVLTVNHLALVKLVITIIHILQTVLNLLHVLYCYEVALKIHSMKSNVTFMTHLLLFVIYMYSLSYCLVLVLLKWQYLNHYQHLIYTMYILVSLLMHSARLYRSYHVYLYPTLVLMSFNS